LHRDPLIVEQAAGAFRVSNKAAALG